MKKVIVSVCTVVIGLNALPVLASDTNGKNDCLVYGTNCPNSVDSLPERISKLKTEIAKGEDIYSSEELNKLKRKLKEDNETMRVLQKP